MFSLRVSTSTSTTAAILFSFVLIFVMIKSGKSVPLPLVPTSVPIISWVPSHQLAAQHKELISSSNGGGGGKGSCLIGRAAYSGGLVPGCATQDKIQFLLGFRQPMVTVDNDFQILSHPEGYLSWKISTSLQEPPSNALHGGTHPATQEELYICRAYNTRNELVVGWLAKSGKECIIPQSGPGFPFSIYEVLVLNNSDSDESHRTWNMFENVSEQLESIFANEA